MAVGQTSARRLVTHMRGGWSHICMAVVYTSRRTVPPPTPTPTLPLMLLFLLLLLLLLLLLQAWGPGRGWGRVATSLIPRL